MQLILSTDTDIGIHKKMATIKQESPHEMDATVSLVEEIMNNITNENKENVDKGDLVIECTEKVSNEKNNVDESIADTVHSKDNLRNRINQTEEEDSHSEINFNSTIDCKTEIVNSGDFVFLQENRIGILDNTTINQKSPAIKQEPIKDTSVNLVYDVDESSRDTILLPSNDIICTDIVSISEGDKTCDSNKSVTENEEVIVTPVNFVGDDDESSKDTIVLPSYNDTSTELVAFKEVDKPWDNNTAFAKTDELIETPVNLVDYDDESSKDTIVLQSNASISIQTVADDEVDKTCCNNNKTVTKNEEIMKTPVNLVDDDDESSRDTIVLPSNSVISTDIVAVDEVDKSCCKKNKVVIENEKVINIADKKPNLDVKESEMLSSIIELPEDVVNVNSENMNDVAVIISDTKDSTNKSSDSENKPEEGTHFIKPVESSVIDIDSVEETEKINIDVNEMEDVKQRSKKNTDKSTIGNTNNTKDELPIETKGKEKTKLTLISNLYNTLDILSDEEEDSSKQQEAPNHISDVINKQCINIEDDDDIMLIDDEVMSKDNTSVTTDVAKAESEHNVNEATLDQKDECEINKREPLETTNYNMGTILPETETIETNTVEEDIKKKDETVPKLPLLPVTFLETCKKNLSSMTHEELEEFCIIKIVESVVDRSNLGEIRSQLKTMVQKIEGYEKKVYMLTKQNRDLQLVLKSVQEEQKKNSGSVTPLKITRSVGMQVLMTDKNSRKRPIGLNNLLNNQNATNSPNRQNKPQPQTTQNQKNTKLSSNNQQIPVPRLVPAGNTGNTKTINSAQATNNTFKSQTTNNGANGVKTTTPTQKPEKRSHFKMQQSSATVDLTDDEPPTKVLTRNNNAPVRCVPPQNLLAPRPPLVQNMSTPRKVYIPIGGPQSQNGQIHKERTGQTVMLRSISPQTNRPRVPSPNLKMIQNTNNLRMGRVTFKHPAPLPDTMKQYQPPNWKSIPPAPELKLSKVENGIVISWKIDGYKEEFYEEIASYQLFAYQETSTPPSTSLWKKIGDVKALPLPMACTLTQFIAGFKYYFAVRSVDVKSRFGPFSKPGSILLFNTV